MNLGSTRKIWRQPSRSRIPTFPSCCRGRKAPPAPGRTDIYDKMGEFLKLPAGELSRLAEVQRQEELKKRVARAARYPSSKSAAIWCSANASRKGRWKFAGFSGKSPSANSNAWSRRSSSNVAQGVAREELRSEEWLRSMAQLSGRSYEQIRVAVLEFLDTDVFNISIENCVSFLDPMIDSWDIDVKTFAMEVVPNRRACVGQPEAVRVCRTTDPTGFRRRTRPGTIPVGQIPQRRCHRGGDRIPEDAAVQRPAAGGLVLLPGAAKPKGPAALHRCRSRVIA